MTREEAIMFLKLDKQYTGKCFISDAIDMAIEALEQAPRWIPTRERYPKPENEFKSFLVTDDEGKVSVQKLYLSLEKEPQPYFSGMLNVVAWMPLPKAYKAEREDIYDRNYMSRKKSK